MIKEPMLFNAAIQIIINESCFRPEEPMNLLRLILHCVDLGPGLRPQIVSST